MERQTFDLIAKLSEKVDSLKDQMHNHNSSTTEKLGEYNATLVRLTATVEHHVRRSDLADEDRAMLRQQLDSINKKIVEIDTVVEHVEGEVTGLKEHVSSIQKFTSIFSILFSTKSLKWLIAFMTVVSTAIGIRYVAKKEEIPRKVKWEKESKEKSPDGSK